MSFIGPDEHGRTVNAVRFPHYGNAVALRRPAMNLLSSRAGRLRCFFVRRVLLNARGRRLGVGLSLGSANVRTTHGWRNSMAKKKITAEIKLQVQAAKATPAPPVGPALGPHGVSAPQFVQQFNEATKNYEPGLLIPVVITVYQDRSFTFITKTPPAAVLIKKAMGLAGGSGEPNRNRVGTLKANQLREIAETKLPDLNANDIDAAMKIVAGTARSMGVKVEAAS